MDHGEVICRSYSLNSKPAGGHHHRNHLTLEPEKSFPHRSPVIERSINVYSAPGNLPTGIKPDPLPCPVMIILSYDFISFCTLVLVKLPVRYTRFAFERGLYLITEGDGWAIVMIIRYLIRRLTYGYFVNNLIKTCFQQIIVVT